MKMATDQIQEAHHELDRLQGIITRHEGFIFTLRGWLLTVVGGLLAAYYTDNIEMSEVVLKIALPGIAFLFLILELRHANLVEAVVERVTALENRIADARQPTGELGVGWYDGPKVSEACQEGAHRWWPRHGMTFVLNQAFYVVVILIIVFATVSLPPKLK
jgi:hypothetical protein